MYKLKLVGVMESHYLDSGSVIYEIKKKLIYWEI